MTSLADFQRAFLNAYQADDIDALQPFLSPQTPASRLNIYHSSITGGLMKSLGEIYAVCQALVGDEFFDALAQRYIQETSSTSSDLGDYGATFPAFVEAFEHTQSIPYLADLCRMAWAYHVAKRHPGDPDFDVTLISQGLIKGKSHLPSSAHIIISPYPLLAIWKLCLEGGDETIELNEHDQQHYMVWRHGLEVRIDFIPENPHKITCT